jgi:hypothetical protein
VYFGCLVLDKTLVWIIRKKPPEDRELEVWKKSVVTQEKYLSHSA